MIEELAFHHLGLAARDPDRSRRTLRALGYTLGDDIFDANQHANVQICTSGQLPDVEIIHSEDPESPLKNILERQDEAIYHICFSTRSISRAVETFRRSGQRVVCIAPARPAPLFGGRRVAFYYVRGLGLIELLEDARRDEAAEEQ